MCVCAFARQGSCTSFLSGISYAATLVVDSWGGWRLLIPPSAVGKATGRLFIPRRVRLLQSQLRDRSQPLQMRLFPHLHGAVAWDGAWTAKLWMNTMIFLLKYHDNRVGVLCRKLRVGLLAAICHHIQKVINCLLLFIILLLLLGKKQPLSWMLVHKSVVCYSSCCSRHLLTGGRALGEQAHGFIADDIGWQVSRNPLLCAVWKSVSMGGCGPCQADKTDVKQMP